MPYDETLDLALLNVVEGNNTNENCFQKLFYLDSSLRPVIPITAKVDATVTFMVTITQNEIG